MIEPPDPDQKLDLLSASFKREQYRAQRRTLWLSFLPIVVGVLVVASAWMGVSRARQDLEKARSELEEVRLEKEVLIQDAEEQKARVERATAALREENERLKTNAEELADEVGELTGEVERLRSEEQGLTTRLDEFGRKIEAAESENRDLARARDELRQELRQANDRMTELHAKTERGEHEYRELSESVARLKVEADSAQMTRETEVRKLKALQLAVKAREIQENPELRTLSLLLAVESVRRDPNPPANGLLQRYLAQIPREGVLLEHRTHILGTGFGPDDSYVAVGSADSLRLWDPASGERVREWNEWGRLTAFAVSRDGHRLATVRDNGTASVYDARSGDVIFSSGLPLQDGTLVIVGADSRMLQDVAFSPDGSLLATCGRPGVEILDYETRSSRRPFWSRTPAHGCGFSPNGRYIASVEGSVGGLRLWDPENKRSQFASHRREINGTAFSPDSDLIATASDDGTVRVWEVGDLTEDLEEVRTFEHPDEVNAVVFSRAGDLLATASDDGARVWEVASSSEKIFLRHEDEVKSIAFDATGGYVATGGKDATARVWDVASGRQVAQVDHEKAVWKVRFSPSDKYLVSAEEGKVVRVTRWMPGDLVEEICSRLTRNLTQLEWKKYIGVDGYRPTCDGLPAAAETD